MAVIKGFEVKALKYQLSHDKILVPYGNLYYKNRKVGEVVDDTWGGPMMYNHTSKAMSEKAVMEKILSIATDLGWHDDYKEFSLVMDELIRFKELESDFKKAQKKNEILIVSSMDKTLNLGEASKYGFHDEAIRLSNKASRELIAEIIAENFKPQKPTVIYRELSDFEIK